MIPFDVNKPPDCVIAKQQFSSAVMCLGLNDCKATDVLFDCPPPSLAIAKHYLPVTL